MWIILIWQHLVHSFRMLSLQVVWRRTSQPHPITVGLDIYIPDDRYHVQHIPYRGSWNLMIKNVNMNDAGVYECQISAKERAGSRRLVLLNVLGKCVWSLASLNCCEFWFACDPSIESIFVSYVWWEVSTKATPHYIVLGRSPDNVSFFF